MIKILLKSGREITLTKDMIEEMIMSNLDGIVESHLSKCTCSLNESQNHCECDGGLVDDDFMVSDIVYEETMEEIKYYMNAPCRVVRTISDKFSEIIVSPKFRDDLHGREWCTECIVGNNGTPTSHTCDTYQEIIEALEDVDNTMLVIVESRLLTNEPIEFKEIKTLKQKIKQEYEKFLNAKKVAVKEEVRIFKNKRILQDINKEIDGLYTIISRKKDEIKLLHAEILDKQNKTTTIIPKDIHITEEEIKELQRRDFILTSLENGGLDNWEWYEESYPTNEEFKKNGFETE